MDETHDSPRGREKKRFRNRNRATMIPHFRIESFHDWWSIQIFPSFEFFWNFEKIIFLLNIVKNLIKVNKSSRLHFCSWEILVKLWWNFWKETRPRSVSSRQVKSGWKSELSSFRGGRNSPPEKRDLSNRWHLNGRRCESARAHLNRRAADRRRSKTSTGRGVNER